MRIRLFLGLALLLTVVGLGLLVALPGCGGKVTIPDKDVPVGPPSPPPVPEVPPPGVTFKDITGPAGIRFKHTNGSFGKKLLPETMGSGVAFLDFDNDGKQDILFVNSCYWPGHEDKGVPAPTLALYRNKGDGTFEDVTEKAGLNITMYGMGVAAGDYDNDGWIDVFITGVGGNRLFRNEKGRFVEVTAQAGVGGPGGWDAAARGKFLEHRDPLPFSSSAAWLDYDGDGRLDLFVCNYVTWSPENDLKQPFTLVGIGRAFGPPRAFEGSQCFLYHQKEDGTFEDVSAAAGIQVIEQVGVAGSAQPRAVAKSLGVIICDPDEDGYPDIIVANDTVRNFFFHNVEGPDGKRRFEEIGRRSGVAYAEGQARGAMGIDWGEYRPGMHALLIANFADEPSSFLYLKSKQLIFQPFAAVEGLEGPTRPPLKFGSFFFDYDLDGRLDLLTCNGHLEPDINKVQSWQTHAQAAQLFWNTGRDRKKPCFAEVTAKEAGSDLFQPLVGRGSAYGDINGDGYPDVVLTSNGGPARLLLNEGGTGNHWIRLALEGDGKRSNRSAIGARVKLEADGKVMWRSVAGSRGYLSQSELPVTFGLGKTTTIDRITVYWPGRDAKMQEFKNLAVDKTHTLKQE
jgi:hypothetical protein